MAREGEKRKQTGRQGEVRLGDEDVTRPVRLRARAIRRAAAGGRGTFSRRWGGFGVCALAIRGGEFRLDAVLWRRVNA